jgi:hypothetical protein
LQTFIRLFKYDNFFFVDKQNNVCSFDISANWTKICGDLNIIRNLINTNRYINIVKKHTYYNRDFVKIK